MLANGLHLVLIWKRYLEKYTNNELWVILTHGHPITSFPDVMGNRVNNHQAKELSNYFTLKAGITLIPPFCAH